MADTNTITVPDIGGAENVDVIEVMVKAGDEIQQDDSLITLESEKASMEIPAPCAGKIAKVLVSVGDKVKEGSAILELEKAGESDNEQKSERDIKEEKAGAEETEKGASAEELKTEKKSDNREIIDVLIPDIGGAKDVSVIEIMVSEGDEIKKEQSILTLESDKATMEIPAPESGRVESLQLGVGDKVSEGTRIMTLQVSKTTGTETQKSDKPESQETKTVTPPQQPVARTDVSEIQEKDSFVSEGTNIHAGPAVRRMAHELGVDLSKVKGSARKGRIVKEDVTAFIKERLQKPDSRELGIPQGPSVDFTKFGEIDIQKLNKIKRLTGVNVHRSWISIPHVTQFDEADITELEAFRKSEQQRAEKKGYKLTLLAFVVKAVYQALCAFPQFNTSLDNTGEQLIFKKYYNIGIAVETPNGLVVPVIQKVDQLSVADIAREMSRLSSKAREKGLMPADMSGGCFTISSLGGIGGTAFTPIVNSPEVAILGLSRSMHKPVYREGEFEPRLMLPMSLSYDHRVIDGAEAARFSSYLAELLSDIRRMFLEQN